MATIDSDATPWLKRHYEIQKLVSTVKKLRNIHVYSSNEIIRIAGKHYKSVKPQGHGRRGRISFELRRLDAVFGAVHSCLKQAAEMPSLESLNNFHRSLIDASIGSEQYRRAHSRIRKGLRMVKNFHSEYKLLIASAHSVQEAVRLRREGCGRILSVVKRLKKDLEILGRARRELLKTHVVAEGLPIIVVAGIPNAGKSTLVAAVSTAKPKIAPYPFTTREIIVGKVTRTNPNFYIIDIPGMLDRPFDEYSEIEKKAVAALQSLPDIVLYLFDPSVERIQDIESQVRLLQSVINNFTAKDSAIMFILAVNKIDIADKNTINKLEALVNNIIANDKALGERLCYKGLMKLSALKHTGLEELMKTIVECIKRGASWIYGV